MLKRAFLVLACVAALAGCASAPRVPAASLAAAGIKATGTFGAEVRNVASQLGNVEASEAFTATWQQCANRNLTCKEINEPDDVTAERRRLANVVALRARALDALGAAYAALQTEAAYDQSADLSSAAGDAVKAADSFAAAAAGLSGDSAPPTIPKTVASLADFGFGLLGEHLQRKRILAASRQIATAALQIRAGMIDESAAFARLASYLVDKRTAARITLIKAGLVSRTPIMTDLAKQLNVQLVPGFESIIANSQADQMALQATLRALAQLEVLAAQERYQAAISALSALLRSHADLEKNRPLSIADVERFLAGLDASLANTATNGQ